MSIKEDILKNATIKQLKKSLDVYSKMFNKLRANKNTAFSPQCISLECACYQLIDEIKDRKRKSK